MTIRLELPDLAHDLKPRIMVFGVGGAGGNAVKNMIDSGLEGVEFVIANTDAQALEQSKAERKIQMGVSVTQGLGAGSRPDVGHAAAEEAMPEILENLHGAHMVFVTSGMGGGTGTGASPVIAAAAREHGILTIGVVTKPFQFEGSRRMRVAEEGVAELTKHVDTLLVIPNQNLFRIANEKTTFADAFAMADRVLHSGVASITDLMVKPGLINLDFADVRTVMDEMGKAMMGTGEASGEQRSLEAAQAAISNPLLDDISMRGARGVLINITGGLDMTLYEVDEAANHIRSEVDDDCNIIIGSTFDPELDGLMRVSVVATGIDGEMPGSKRPSERDEIDTSISGKVCSIHSMSSGMQGARAKSAAAPAADVRKEDGARVVAPPRSPISLGHVERRNDRRMDKSPLQEESTLPQQVEEKQPNPISASTSDSGISVTHHYDPDHDTDLIFNIPSNANTDAMNSGNSRNESGEMSAFSESCKNSEDAALADPGLVRTPIAPVQKRQRRAFWNFWFGGSEAAKRKAHPATASSSENELKAGEDSGSLAENAEDQLEIPAFLRRQAN